MPTIGGLFAVWNEPLLNSGVTDTVFQDTVSDG
jgi:hypothetical protein